MEHGRIEYPVIQPTTQQLVCCNNNNIQRTKTLMSSSHSLTPPPSPSSPGKRLKRISEEDYIREIESLRKMYEAELSKRDDTISKQNAEKEAKSLLSVLPGRNAPIPNLIPRDMPTSNKQGGRGRKKQAVTVSQMAFDVPDLRDLDDRLGLELRNTDSRLRNLINSGQENLTYEKEYDVQFIVQHALQDAVQICNIIIGKKVNVLSLPTPPKLCVRCESSLFSNIVDHAVVFDAVSGHPVFIVEVKRRWGNETSPATNQAPEASVGATPSTKTWEQVYFQLSEMHAKGHQNPFGALTCFDETYITCLDTTACKEVLTILSTMQYEDSRLDRIVSNLVQTNATISTPDHTGDYTVNSSTPVCKTQSPLQEQSVTPCSNIAKPSFYKHKDFHVWHSACFVPENMVAAFVSGIFCSLDGYQTPRYIKRFEIGQGLNMGALCIMSKKPPFWGTLQTTYRGPKKLMAHKIGPLYLVDHLGTGSTSKVYHALTLNGHECVVKIYVMRKDEDNRILPDKAFKKNAKAAVKTEYQAYTDIYGKELEGYVRMIKLNNLQCLILPYFKHVDKSQRKGLLSSTIRERLKLFHNRRRKKFCAFHKSDQLWRHIGWFNGKLYLFDLGDLEEHSLVKKDDLIDSHCKRLAARIEE